MAGNRENFILPRQPIATEKRSYRPAFPKYGASEHNHRHMGICRSQRNSSGDSIVARAASPRRSSAICRRQWTSCSEPSLGIFRSRTAGSDRRRLNQWSSKMSNTAYYITNESSEDRLDCADTLADALRIARELAREG